MDECSNDDCDARFARIAASTRLRTCSFCIMVVIVFFTVVSARLRIPAISPLVHPLPTSLRIYCSRSVS